MVKEKLKEKPKEGFKRVGGWLYLLVLTLIVSCVQNFWAGATDVFSMIKGKLVPPVYLYSSTCLEILFFGGSIALAICAIYSLIKLKPNGISLAKMYLILIFLTNLIVIIFVASIGIPLVGKNSYFGGIDLLIESLLFVVIWFLYLTFSKRVKSTYPAEKRKFSLSVKVFFFFMLVIPLAVFLLIYTGIENSAGSSMHDIKVERPLAENEYSDGRIFFKKPLDMEIEKNESSKVPFYILFKEQMSINLASSLASADHKQYFEGFYKGAYNALSEGHKINYTVIKEKQGTINGFEYIEKSIKIYGAEVFIWTVIVIFDDQSTKIAGIGYFSSESNDSINSQDLDEVMNSIKFS